MFWADERRASALRRFAEDFLAVHGVKRRADHAFVMQVGAEGDPYYVYPVPLAAGGWLFGRDREGRLDAGVIGLGTPETPDAFERFRGLGPAECHSPAAVLVSC